MLSSALDWYQERIGLYDKQSWETTVEQRIHRGWSNFPKRNAKLKTDFIDLDLVRGSTFPKAKPPTDFWLCGFKGILRLIFVPFHWKWWIRETTLIGFCLLLATCFSVGLSCVIYWKHSEVMKEVTVHEVFMPIGLLILLGAMHSHMTCTRSVYRYPVCRKNVWNKRTSKMSRKLLSKQRLSPENKGKSYLYDRLTRSSKWSEPRSLSEDIRSLKGVSLMHKANPISKSQSLSCLSDRYDSNNSQNQRDFFLNVPLCNKVATSTDCGNTSGDLASSSEGIHQPIFNKLNKKDSSNEHLSPVYIHTNASNSHLRYRRKHKTMRSYSKSYAWHYDQNTDAYDYSSPLEVDSQDATDEEYVHTPPPSKTYSFLRKTSLKRNYLGRYSTKPKAKCISDWIGTSSNGEAESCSSESDPGFEFNEIDQLDDTIDWQIQGAPAAVIPSKSLQPSEKVSCKIWEGKEVKKGNLSVLDISSIVISKVDQTKEKSFYLFFGISMAVINASVPTFHRYFTMEAVISDGNATNCSEAYLGNHMLMDILGNSFWSSSVIILSCINRFLIGGCFLFLLSVTERTFRQRLLHAKYFCYLTSARRARKYDVPHFRLNKVVNIKAWLSIRSCLKKCGPQHSVDVIVSVTFILTSLLISYLCFEALKDEERSILPLRNCEFFIWCFSVSIYLIRFMTLAANINKKYSNPSILVMEQINMYLHLEQKPEKKEDLMLANNVLKLVTVLLKELDNPFKISGISANPVLYNVTKVVMLSACSAVLSDILGFKLKLHRIKFK